MRNSSLGLTLLLPVAAAALAFEPIRASGLRPEPGQGPSQEREGPPDARRQALVASLAEQGIQLDFEQGLVVIPVTVEVRDDLLEYLLVGPGGAVHESTFRTQVQPSVLNVALLALGVEPGTNARWNPKPERPTEEELRAGVSPYDVHVPGGDGFHLYSAWREAGETYFFRVEDLVRNLMTGRTMRRHRWVYLGSRMVPSGRRGAAGQEDFAADVYQNLINVAFFSDGYTMLTGSLPECVEQTIWMTNAWLVPERGSELRLIFSLEPLDALPESLAGHLPEVPSTAAELGDGGR